MDIVGVLNDETNYTKTRNYWKYLKAKLKKEAQLVIRLDHALRDEFVEACQQVDTTASRELRRFMKRFITQYKNGELDD